MKKLLLSLIATALFTFAASSATAQQKTPVKKDTTEKSKKPAMPMPDSTVPPDRNVPVPNAPAIGPDTPTKPVPPEKTKPRNPSLPQVPDNPPPVPTDPASQPV